jgi:alpha-glucosidase
MHALKSSLILTVFFFFTAVSARAFQAKSFPQENPPTNYTSQSDSTIWWKHAVVYEIYPRSFQDTDGNGIGDLKGIEKRLDYLQNLGVDAIWLTPIYPSPQVDFGYDVADYEAIDSMYGTMDDFDQLLSEAKKHHIRIMMDMVLNHTSDKSKWFQESKSSRDNPKADWYVWNSGVPADSQGVTAFQKSNEHDGMVPPNNWESTFGGSAWQWVPARKQFYYHMFYRQQPDLNWRNPEVRKAMFNVLRFWLDKGVAGFRLDAIETLFEDPKLRDEKVMKGKNAYGDPNMSFSRQSDLPKIHKVMRKLRKVVDSYPGHRVLIGETYVKNTSDLLSMYGKHGKQLQLPMDTQVGFINKLDASKFRQKIYEAENDLKGHIPLFVFDNHDNPRSWNRYGDSVHNTAIAKGLATLLLTTRSVALMYYGQELGMVTTPPERQAACKDPICITGWPKEKGRDGERTPMQWTAGPQASFSANPNTWLPIPPNHKWVNVETESSDSISMLNWYKQLIKLRRTNSALRDGGMKMLNKDNKDVVSYLRTTSKEDSSIIVAVNMSDKPQILSFNLKQSGNKKLAVHTLATDKVSLYSVPSLKSVTLPPFASWVGLIH